MIGYIASNIELELKLGLNFNENNIIVLMKDLPLLIKNCSFTEYEWTYHPNKNIENIFIYTIEFDENKSSSMKYERGDAEHYRYTVNEFYLIKVQQLWDKEVLIELSENGMDLSSFNYSLLCSIPSLCDRDIIDFLIRDDLENIDEDRFYELLKSSIYKKNKYLFDYLTNSRFKILYSSIDIHEKNELVKTAIILNEYEMFIAILKIFNMSNEMIDKKCLDIALGYNSNTGINVKIIKYLSPDLTEMETLLTNKKENFYIRPKNLIINDMESYLFFYNFLKEKSYDFIDNLAKSHPCLVSDLCLFAYKNKLFEDMKVPFFINMLKKVYDSVNIIEYCLKDKQFDLAEFFLSKGMEIKLDSYCFGDLVHEKRYDAIDFLFKHNFFDKISNKRYVFNVLTETKNLYFLQAMIKNGFDFVFHSETLIYYALLQNNKILLEFLFANGVDINQNNGFALIDTIKRGEYDLAQFLIEHGADIHIRDDYIKQMMIDKTEVFDAEFEEV